MTGLPGYALDSPLQQLDLHARASNFPFPSIPPGLRFNNWKIIVERIRSFKSRVALDDFIIYGSVVQFKKKATNSTNNNLHLVL